MLLDLLSTSNYVSYNIKLAEILGLHTAIYLSEIMNIQDKAIRKNKINGNYFKLDREYIASRTTICEKEQLEIEQNLLKIGVLEKGEFSNELCLNITTLTTIMMDVGEELIGTVKKLIKAKQKVPRATKAEQIKSGLKQHIETTNEELREAYCDWIDAVYSKQGWLSVKAITHAQEVVDNFSKRDLDIALRVIEIATISGYRDMQWAVDRYSKNSTINYKVLPPTNDKASLSEEVF